MIRRMQRVRMGTGLRMRMNTGDGRRGERRRDRAEE